MVIAEVAAAYEIARWNGLTSPTSNTALDLYAGGRAWWQRADAQFSASGTLNIFDLEQTKEGTLSAKANVSWVDPVVGARLRHQFAPAWNLVVSGDVGGFGAGSKFSWQAIGALDHDIYVITFTERQPQGHWEAQDDLRITGYGEPKEHKSYYVASSVEVAAAHWKYWLQYTDAKRERTFVSIERLARPTLLLEI